MLFKQEDVKRCLKKISDKDSQIQILKVPKTDKQLLTRTTEMEQNVVGKSANDMVRKVKWVLYNCIVLQKVIRLESFEGQTFAVFAVFP